MKRRKCILIMGSIFLCVLLIGVYSTIRFDTLSTEARNMINFKHISENVSVYEQAGFEIEQSGRTVILNNRADNPTIEIYLYNNELTDTPLEYRIQFSRNLLNPSIATWLVLYADVYQEGHGSMKIWLDCSSRMDGIRQLEVLIHELFSLQ